MRALSSREALFVKHYLSNLNAVDAARQAGWSETYAKKQGYRILKRPGVQAAIAFEQADRSERLKVTADKVVLELAKIAFLDLNTIVSVENGKVVCKNSAELTEEQRSAISEISQTKESIKVKAHDKLGALEMLGRHLGMFTDNIRHSGELKVLNELTDEELERIAAGSSDGNTPPAPGTDSPA